MHEAFQPISLVTALWPTQEFQFPEHMAPFAERLIRHMGLFDEQQICPPEAIQPQQHEMPRLILLGDQRRWGLELAPGKLLLRHTLEQTMMPLEQVFESQYAVLGPAQAWLAENLCFRPYRVGVVAHFFCNTRSSANERIAQYFLHPRALQGQAAHEVQLSLLTRLSLDGVLVNRWLRARPLRSVDPSHVDFAAQIEVDINTMPEDTQVRTARDVVDFLRLVRQHLEFEIPLLANGEFLGG